MELKVSHNLCYPFARKILNFITFLFSTIVSIQLYFIFHSLNQDVKVENSLFNIGIFTIEEGIIFTFIFLIVFLLMYIFKYLFFSFLSSLFLGSKKIIVTDKTIEFRPCKKFKKEEIDFINLKENKKLISRKKFIEVSLKNSKRERFTKKLIKVENFKFYIFSDLKTIENFLFSEKA
jgi:hypothetical protein